MEKFINYTQIVTSLLAVVGIVFEITPIKINPISWIFKWIGKQINSEINRKVDSMSSKINILEQNITDNRKKELRIHISNFASDLKNGVPKSESQYIAIIGLCDEYLSNKWNSKVKMDAEFIKEVYKNLYKKIKQG